MRSKAYLEIDGVKYYGYDIAINVRNRGRAKLPAYCVNNDVFTSLVSGWLLDETMSPAEGSEIYVATECRIPTEDLKAHYKIKKKEDTGDFNVFEPVSNFKIKVYVERLAIFPSEKRIFADTAKHTDKEMLILASEVFPSIDTSDAVFTDRCSALLWPNDSKGNYPLLLEGLLSKPCISASALKITGGNSLTVDVLWMAYMAATVTDFHSNVKQNINNFIMQLNVMNQCNWTDFPGAMAVWNEIIKDTALVRRINRSRSQFPKVVHRIIPKTLTRSEFSCNEDRRLAQEFVARVLKLREDTMFIAMDSLTNLLLRNHLTLYTFNTLYDTTVRIKERKWKDIN